MFLCLIIALPIVFLGALICIYAGNTSVLNADVPLEYKDVSDVTIIEEVVVPYEDAVSMQFPVPVDEPLIFPEDENNVSIVSDPVTVFPLTIDSAGEYKGKISLGFHRCIAILEDGSVINTAGDDLSKWRNVVCVAAGGYFEMGLTESGEVYGVWLGKDSISEELEKAVLWKEMQSIDTFDNQYIGLDKNGRILMEGELNCSEAYKYKKEVKEWTDIKCLSLSPFHILGLKRDGTVIATGANYFGQTEVDNWDNIVEVVAGTEHSVGLKSDGTVVAVGNNDSGQCEVGHWNDIVAIAAGFRFTAGLRSDGKVEVAGTIKVEVAGEIIDAAVDVPAWNKIVAIEAHSNALVGITAYGKVVSAGSHVIAEKTSDWDLWDSGISDSWLPSIG